MSDTRVAIITGATTGLGESMAVFFASKGITVVLAGRRQGLGEAVAQKIKDNGGQAFFKRTDVTNDSELSDLFAFAKEKFGGIDILVNNAGIEKVVQLSAKNALEDYDTLFAVNVRPTVAAFNLAVPLLEARKGGVIVNMSSVLSVMPAPSTGVYGASKAALDQLTAVAAVELADKNIRVYAMNPALFATSMADRVSSAMSFADADTFAAQFNPSKKIGQPEELGEFIYELIEKQHDDRFPSGSAIFIDAGKDTLPVRELLGRLAAANKA